MSKKMMKRTAALSALIAISLSGTVFAADISETTTYNPAGADVTCDNFKVDTTGFYGVRGNGSITAGADAVVNSTYCGVLADGGELKITADNIYVTAAGDPDGPIGVWAYAQDSKISLIAEGDVEIEGSMKGIYANGKNTGVTVKGTDVSVGHDIEAKAVGATINVTGTNSVTIDGTVRIGELGSGSTINIDGKNITIDGGDDYGVSVRGGYYGFSKPTTANIGTADTESITVKGYGIISQYEDANINFYGDKLNVEATGSYGIYTGNNSEAYSPSAEVNIYTDHTKIDMVNGGSAVVAFSQSTLNIENGLETSGGNAILARGNSTVNVNQSGNGDVKLDGDIVFDSQGTGKFISADNTVNLNLSKEGSYLNGNIYVANSGGSTETYEDVSNMNLTMAEGTTWTSDEDSFVNNLTNNGGTIAMMGEDQALNIDNLDMTDATVVTNSLGNVIDVADSSAVSNTSVVGTENLTKEIEETSNLNDALDTLSNVVGPNGVTSIELAEGALLGATTATVGANGVTNVITKENIANAGLIDMTALSFMAWRGENDDLNERLGDLRSANGERGIWTRMSRAQQSYNTVTNQYNMYQIGYDQHAGDWTLGAAYSYTDGKSWFEKGTGENTHNVFSLYGTKMNNNGSFIDVVAKYGNLDYEYTLAGGVGGGDYDTDAYSFSVETGKRITSSNGAWVEPQLQLTYGTVDGTSFTTQNGFGVNMDSADSFVARAGIMAGKPVYKGNIYLKASYLYDFAGEVEGTFSNGTNRVDISRDLGGGWWEVGAGANFNLSDATQLYLDFEKAIAGEAEVEWKWNAGVRYSF